MNSVIPASLRSQHLRRSSWLRLLLPLTLLLVAACTGSDGEEPGPNGSGSASDPTDASGGGALAPGELADAYWDLPATIDTAIVGAEVTTLRAIDDELWTIVRRGSGSSVYRSVDGGASWTPIDVASPPAEGGLVLTDIVRGDSGRYVIAASVESRCQLNIDTGDGFRSIGTCRDQRPVLFLSDDGDSWRRVDPPAMVPPDDAAIVLENIVADINGFLAAGTVRAADWHARLWSSPDGETWTLDRELRDEAYPMSSRQVLSDGSTVVLLVAVHTCATPSVVLPADWYLGAGARAHVRIFEGSTAADVQDRQAGEHPLAVPPADVDCAGSTFARVPYPSTRGALVGSAITLLQTPPPPADEAVTDRDPYQVATLTDGVWTVTRVDQPSVDPDAQRVDLERLLDVDGRLGLIFSQYAEDARLRITAILPDGENAWAPPEFGLPLVASDVGGQLWIDGSLLLAGTLRVDPYLYGTVGASPRDVFAWRSIDGETWASQGCELVPGGACRFADLSRLDGYPDFAGRDLSGIDLSFSELGEANFDGANFRGARLWDATGWAASFVGADLTGAAVQNASIGDASGANFTDANLRRARIDGADGAILEGATLALTRFEFRERPSIPAAGWPGARVTWAYDKDSGEPNELSLAGIDLTDMEIQGWFGDGPPLKVTDLTGATLTGTAFYRVDLSEVDPDIDLSEVEFWNGSICPGGEPQDGDPKGTCIRS